MEKEAKIKLTGLWEKLDKKGTTFFTGNLGSGKILIYKNSYKTKENQPDYIVYLAEIRKKEDGQSFDKTGSLMEPPQYAEDEIPF